MSAEGFGRVTGVGSAAGDAAAGWTAADAAPAVSEADAMMDESSSTEPAGGCAMGAESSRLNPFSLLLLFAPAYKSQRKLLTLAIRCRDPKFMLTEQFAM